MAANLCDAKLQIEWAKAKADDLNIIVNKFFSSQPYEIFRESEPDGLRETINIRLAGKLPSNIKMLAGDAIHALGVSLDYAVCSLAELNGKTPNGVSFPFASDPNCFEAEAKKKIRKLSPAARDFICALEPYPGGKIKFLWPLHDLDIAHKHRRIVAVGMQSAVRKIGFNVAEDVKIRHISGGWQSLKDGIELMSVKKGSALQSNVQIEGNIAFGDVEIVKGEPVSEILTQMSDMTTRIINDIDTIFFI